MPIGESSCVSCGHCVTVCPCNALMETTMLGHAGFMTSLPASALNAMIGVIKGIEPETGYGAIMQISEAEAAMRQARIRRTKTVCTYCGVGCTFDVWTKDRDILKVEAGEGPANGISTCVKGKFALDYVNSGDRLRTPLVRDGDVFRRATWDEALDLVARRLSDVKAAHGPDAIGFIASSKCTNEESYLTQKLARAVIGTNNIDNCSRYCQAPATTGLFRTVGYGGDSGSIADIEQAGLVVIIGSNTAESHPVLATRVKQAHKLRGQTLIVSDRREHEMARRADVFLRTNTATDLVWLSAVSRYLLDHDLANTEFLQTWSTAWRSTGRASSRSRSRSPHAPCGVPVETLKQVAHMIAEARSMCILWAMGVTQQINGSDTSTAISNLLLLTGNYMRPGTGAYPLRGHNNVQGTSDNGSIQTSCPAIRRSTTRRCGRASRRGGRCPSPPPGDSTTTRWWMRFSTAGCTRCTSWARSSASSNANATTSATRWRSSTSSSCRTSSSPRPAATPTSSCPPVRAWRRKAPSPARSGASSASTGSSTRSRDSRGRLADHAGPCEPARRALELRPSIRDHA